MRYGIQPSPSRAARRMAGALRPDTTSGGPPGCIGGARRAGWLDRPQLDVVEVEEPAVVA